MADNLWTALATGLASIGISVGSFGFVLKGQSNKLKAQDDKLKVFDEEKLDKEMHVLMCENSTLSLKTHMTDTMTEFKDEIMD